MKRGILTVAFGDEYVKIAKACMEETKKHTDLPVYVLTNRKEPFGDFGLFVPAGDEENRNYKTSMVDYTPFDETLYIDCDSIIQKSDLSPVFDKLEHNDVVLNQYLHWNKGDKILNIYKRAMNTFNVNLPMSVYNGAMIAFKKNSRVHHFFRQWNARWELFGKGREMPPLACTIASMKELKVGTTPRGFFNPETLTDEATIQHHTGQNFLDKFNLPSWKRWTPFDTDPKDFTWTEM